MNSSAIWLTPFAPRGSTSPPVDPARSPDWQRPPTESMATCAQHWPTAPRLEPGPRGRSPRRCASPHARGNIAPRRDGRCRLQRPSLMPGAYYSDCKANWQSARDRRRDEPKSRPGARSRIQTSARRSRRQRPARSGGPRLRGRLAMKAAPLSYRGSRLSHRSGD